MSQGTGWDRETVVQTLEPYFRLGYSVKKACILANFPFSTFYGWYREDEMLRTRIKALQGMVSARAREVVASSVKDGNREDARWWLERREKKDFSPRQEVSGPRGTPLYDLSKETLEKVEEFEDLEEAEDYEEENTDV